MSKLFIKKTEAEEILGSPLPFSDGEQEVEIENLDPERTYIWLWDYEDGSPLDKELMEDMTWDECQEKYLVYDILYQIGIDADLTTTVPVSLLTVPGSERTIEDLQQGTFLYINLDMD